MTVSWSMKLWPDYSDNDKRGLAKHLREMDKHKRIDYIKYLGNYCGAPTDSLMNYVKNR